MASSWWWSVRLDQFQYLETLQSGQIQDKKWSLCGRTAGKGAEIGDAMSDEAAGSLWRWELRNLHFLPKGLQAEYKQLKKNLQEVLTCYKLALMSRS